MVSRPAAPSTRRILRPALPPGGPARSAGSPARRAGVAAVVALAYGLAATAVATADTARIVTDQMAAGRTPARASIVVTGVDGNTRTLGPFSFPETPYGLRRSPDGRYFAVSWGDAEVADRGLVIVPADGGTAFRLRPRRPGGTAYDVSPSRVSWSSDSRDVVLGDVRDDEGDGPGDVVRCSVAHHRCTVVPGVAGYAATVPGAIVTGTTAHRLAGLVARYDPDGWGGPDERPADGPTRRALVRHRQTDVAHVTPRRTRILLRRRASVLQGVDAATGIVGGPSGALVTVDRYRLRRVVQRGETFVRWGGIARRWVVVGARGATATVKPRRLPVPREHAAIAEDIDTGMMLIRAQRAHPEPRTSIASGGWLATTGTTPFAARTGGLVLTTITPQGRAAFVRTGGQIASAAQLVRSVLARRTAYRGTAALVVVGHESATNAAIVDVSWDERDPKPGDPPPAALPGTAGIVPFEDSSLRRHATVRVPLDGRTPPTVVSGAPEHAAW